MSAGSVAEYHPFTTEDNNDVLGKGRQLYRGNAIDLQRPEGRNKMERGISRATENEYLVNQARSQVEQDFTSPDTPDCNVQGNVFFGGGPIPVTGAGFIETPLYTFTLPDLSTYPEDFRGFLEKDLIELSSLISLEQSGRLNWWAETGTCQRLWPLATTGDGNCLLHAASLGMWGFHDRLLTLRKALHTFLSSSESSASIYRRWRLESHLQNVQLGLTLSEAEWRDEWSSVLHLASTEPRTVRTSSEVPPPTASRRRSRLSVAFDPNESIPVAGGGDSVTTTLYESLEEIHVLALAHVLRRPIIVVADTVLRNMNGEALAPIPFGGIYLPLECPPEECHKNPLLLTYNTGHFSALVSMQSANNVLPTVIPVTDTEHVLLPIHFAVDPGSHFRWNHDELDAPTLHPQVAYELLLRYLDLVQVQLPECFVDPKPPTPPPPPSHQATHQRTGSNGSTCNNSTLSNNTGYIVDPSYGQITNSVICDVEEVPNGTCHHQNRSKTAKQIQSVAKQFGSIGKTVSKKLKKNFGKLGRTGSLRKQTQSTRIRERVVSGSQAFILAAMIHTNKRLPFQNEMIENYLEEAKIRFEKDKELKVKQREEQREQSEKRQREIYLDGGFTDCVSPGCEGRGTSDTSYLCRSCFDEQNREIRQSQSVQDDVSNVGKSRFYVASSAHSYPGDGVELQKLTLDEATPMRVQLPGASSAPVAPQTIIAPPTQPCRNPKCDFFGTPNFEYFCSKCFQEQRSISR